MATRGVSTSWAEPPRQAMFVSGVGGPETGIYQEYPITILTGLEIALLHLC